MVLLVQSTMNPGGKIIIRDALKELRGAEFCLIITLGTFEYIMKFCREDSQRKSTYSGLHRGCSG